MEAEYVYLDHVFVITQAIQLTTSLEQNALLSIKFWQDFNQRIKRQHLTQGKDFVKYAITLREQNKLQYLCGIPSNGNYPINFQLTKLPRSHYIKFIHQGDMNSIKDSIRYIFEIYIPTHDIKRKQGPIQYFERYTSTFHFDREDSIVEIYVPIILSSSSMFPTIPAKSILSGGTSIQSGYNKFSWFGMDYNMNLYKGCNHGCIYCDSRSNCYQVEHFDIVRGKEDELRILEQELKKKRKKGTVGIGAMSDTYNPYEKEQCITRDALLLLEKYGFGVGIDTKSDLILRDIDIIERINKKYPSIIKVTITCADDELARILEPNASSSSERFNILQEFHEHGVYAGILLMPLLPYINGTEDNIRRIVELAHLHHAKFIYPCLGMTMRDNQRDYFYYELNTYFPGKLQLYEQRYHNVYSCDIPDVKRLYMIFKKECQKYGIVYKMNDIIKGYKSVIPNEQIALNI